MEKDTSLWAIVWLTVIGVAQASPPYNGLTGYRYNEPFCGDTVSGRQLYVGEVFTRHGQCVRVQCLGTLRLWEDSCKSPVGLKGNCVVLPPNESNLDYPRCCPLYECKTYESSAQGKMEQTNTYDHSGTLRKSYLTEVIVINKDRRLRPDEIPTVPVRKYEV